ncbi:hypothetical protein COLO4_21096 [Corchorus olitorius]|uniref:RING-type E3 ubiquitin transferase n=1 Tax=Corchorus olitorius TaxID=93759 RepID=A0A1R3IV94_9ROSI|nr:hypothetical protein COLO4_21096 [Corchorus olitorius]
MPPFSDESNVPTNTTVVAIDRDKNSPHAVRWAIDHLVITNPLIILIHVRLKNRRGQQTKGALRSPGPERLSFDNPGRATPTRERDRFRNSPANLSLDSIEFGTRGQSSGVNDSLSGDMDFPANLALGSMDISSQNLDFSMVSSSSSESLPQSSANELNQWKMEEARKFEEARLAEEAALQMAEMEKAKCKAAIEAAEAAQRLAEMEAQRRRHAELKAKKESEEKNRALTALAHNDVRYRKYTIEEIEEATEKFAESNKIGEGGYGPVYKGKLDHTPVAIKVLRPDAAQGQKQFQQEVEVLCCIRHPNMVLLLGACPEYGCLVYEHMSHGSLEDRLFRRGNTPPLSWRRRFKIAAEIATALLFLHQAKPEPLVHRDLKPANILLDRNYVSKISDVGLARLVPPSVADTVTQYHMTSAAGTFCYIDPEYQQTGMLTTKSDIYSLGIMLLQIITAKSPMGLAHHVGRAIEKGTLSDMLDPAVPDWPVEEALSFAKLSLKCAELRKRDRPDLATVIVPELNRLRELGRSASESRSLGYSGGAHSSSGYSNANSNSGQSRSRSSAMSPLSRSRISSTSQESMSKESAEPMPSSGENGAE